MDKVEQLLLDICKCPNVTFAMQDKNHPCHSVVSVQNNSNEFQVPEPWTGNLGHSKLLIIASNPSIDESEAYPTDEWRTRGLLISSITDLMKIMDGLRKDFTCFKKIVLILQKG